MQFDGDVFDETVVAAGAGGNVKKGFGFDADADPFAELTAQLNLGIEASQESVSSGLGGLLSALPGAHGSWNSCACPSSTEPSGVGAPLQPS